MFNKIRKKNKKTEIFREKKIRNQFDWFTNE